MAFRTSGSTARKIGEKRRKIRRKPVAVGAARGSAGAASSKAAKQITKNPFAGAEASGKVKLAGTRASGGSVPREPKATNPTIRRIRAEQFREAARVGRSEPKKDESVLDEIADIASGIASDAARGTIGRLTASGRVPGTTTRITASAPKTLAEEAVLAVPGAGVARSALKGAKVVKGLSKAAKPVKQAAKPTKVASRPRKSAAEVAKPKAAGPKRAPEPKRQKIRKAGDRAKLEGKYQAYRAASAAAGTSIGAAGTAESIRRVSAGEAAKRIVKAPVKGAAKGAGRSASAALNPAVLPTATTGAVADERPGRLLSAPYQAARAVAEVGPSQAGTEAKAAREMLYGIPGALYEIATDPKSAAGKMVEDYKRRYGPLLEGDSEKFRQIVKEEGALPVVLDSMIVAPPASHVAGSLARSGALGAKAQRWASQPRMVRRISEGEESAPRQRRGVIGVAAGQVSDWRAGKRTAKRSAKGDSVARLAEAADQVVPSRSNRAIRRSVAGMKSRAHHMLGSEQSRVWGDVNKILKKGVSKAQQNAIKEMVELGIRTPESARRELDERIRQIEANRAGEEVGKRADNIPELRAIRDKADEIFTPELGRAVSELNQMERRLVGEAEDGSPSRMADPDLTPERAELRRWAPMAIHFGIERKLAQDPRQFVRRQRRSADRKIRKLETRRAREAALLRASERSDRSTPTRAEGRLGRQLQRDQVRSARAQEMLRDAELSDRRTPTKAERQLDRQLRRQQLRASRLHGAAREIEKNPAKAEQAMQRQIERLERESHYLQGTVNELEKTLRSARRRAAQRGKGRMPEATKSLQRKRMALLDAEANLAGVRSELRRLKETRTTKPQGSLKKRLMALLDVEADIVGLKAELDGLAGRRRSDPSQSAQTKQLSERLMNIEANIAGNSAELARRTRDRKEGPQSEQTKRRSERLLETELNLEQAKRVKKAAVIRSGETPTQAARRVERQTGLKRFEGETNEGYIARIDLERIARDLERPGYFPSEMPRRATPRSQRAVGGTRASLRSRKYTGDLFRRGIERRDVATLVRGFERNVKRRYTWNLVSEIAQRHSFPWGRNATLSEIHNYIRKNDLDDSDIRLLSPGMIRNDVLTDIEGSTRGLGPLDERMTSGGADMAELLDAATEIPRKDFEAMPDWFKEQGGWYAVPASVMKELEASFKSTIGGRIADIAISKAQRLMLGLNFGWAEFQFTSNIVQALAAGATPWDMVRGSWFAHRNLDQAHKDQFGAYAGMSLANEMQQATRLGAKTNNEAVNAYRLMKESKFGRIMSQAWPLNVFFRLARHTDNFPRTGVMYHLARKEAFKNLNQSTNRLWRLQDQITRIMDLDPEGQISALMKDPKVLERHAREMMEFMGDYTTFTAAERMLLKRVVPFYSWIRFSVRFALYTMPVRHPVVTGLLYQLGQLKSEEVKELLGGDSLPWALGRIYFTDSAGDLKSINFARANPALNALVEFEDPRDLSSLLPPYATAILNQAFRRDMWSGKDFRIRGETFSRDATEIPLEERARILMNDLLSTFTPFRLWHQAEAEGQSLGTDSLPFSLRPIEYEDEEIQERGQDDFEERGGPWGLLKETFLPIIPANSNRIKGMVEYEMKRIEDEREKIRKFHDKDSESDRDSSPGDTPSGSGGGSVWLGGGSGSGGSGSSSSGDSSGSGVSVWLGG